LLFYPPSPPLKASSFLRCMDLPQDVFLLTQVFRPLSFLAIPPGINFPSSGDVRVSVSTICFDSPPFFPLNICSSVPVAVSGDFSPPIFLSGPSPRKASIGPRSVPYSPGRSSFWFSFFLRGPKSPPYPIFLPDDSPSPKFFCWIFPLRPGPLDAFSLSGSTLFPSCKGNCGTRSLSLAPKLQKRLITRLVPKLDSPPA